MKKPAIIIGFSWIAFAAIFSGCQSSGSYGNEGGTSPINSEEELQYNQAIVRCYKTGGTRVVKILGRLRCY